jgi:hypothetical protein
MNTGVSVRQRGGTQVGQPRHRGDAEFARAFTQTVKPQSPYVATKVPGLIKSTATTVRVVDVRPCSAPTDRILNGGTLPPSARQKSKCTIVAELGERIRPLHR